MKDINVVGMEMAAEIATKESETKLQMVLSEVEAIREEAETTGVLKMVVHQKCHLEFIKYAELYQLKQSKSYKKGGRTWVEYCDEVVGEPQRTVDRILSEIGPIAESFSASLADLLGMPFNKIRMLGRAVGSESAKLAENKLIIDGTEVLLDPENKDEIEAAIGTLIESHKQEKKTLEKKLKRATSDTDKIVEEATKGLTVERDALVKEIERLKPYDITDKDVSWSVDLIEEMKDQVAGFTVAASKLIMDERLKEDMHLQAKAEQMILLMHRMTGDLNRTWDDVFNVYDD